MTARAEAATRQTQEYLTAVEHELADLPAEDRSALVEDLASHLESLSAEDDDRPIAVRLGPPSAYAADLRAAAGLPARGGAVQAPGPGLRDRLDALLASPVGRRAVPAAREVWRLAGELRPAWWVLRGYLLVLVPCLMTTDGYRDFPVPAPLGSNEFGFVLVILAIAGSVALGRRALPRPASVLVAAFGAVLLLAAGAVAQGELQQQELDYSNASSYAAASVFTIQEERAAGRYPLVSRYGPVTDVLPYAADGTPLEGVLLYDQDGRPLKVGFQEWWADGCARVLEQPRAADGVPVPHSYPQVYEPSGSGVDGSLLPAGRCSTDQARPEVPLPTFSSPVG